MKNTAGTLPFVTVGDVFTTPVNGPVVGWLVKEKPHMMLSPFPVTVALPGNILGSTTFAAAA